MNKYFSFSRFTKLLRKEAQINIKRDLLIIVAMYSLFTIIMSLVFQFGSGDYSSDVLENLHFIAFTVMFFIGGFFTASFSFIELRNKMKSHFYLLTPVSNLEKFAANWLISFVGYVLFMLITYLVYSNIFNLIALKIYGIQFLPLDMHSERFSFILSIFAFVHSVFFLGSVSFKKYPIIFTPIVWFLIATALSFFNKLVEKIVFAHTHIKEDIPLDFDDFKENYETLLKLILFCVLPIVIWYITYLKLKEKEY